MKADIYGKFCNLGVVTSVQWSKLFMIIENRMFKIYLNEYDAINRPEEAMLEIPLDGDFRASPWKRKEYEEVLNEKREFYCFYIKMDGVITQNKLFKIGTPDMELAEKIMRCVEMNTHNRTRSTSF